MIYDYRFAAAAPGTKSLSSHWTDGDWSNCEGVTREQIHARIDEILDQVDGSVAEVIQRIVSRAERDD